MLSHAKQRQQLMKLHGSKYKRHFLTEGYYCFYCADPAQCLDHVPPLSMMDVYTYEERKKAEIPAVLLSCCSECNSALGSRLLPTAHERLLYLESHYEAYFKKQKSMWSDDEIEELGESLQNSVKARQEKLNRYIDKIRAIQMRQIRVETHPTFYQTME